ILVVAFHLLTKHTDYRELGDAYYDELQKAALQCHHVKRLESLGFQVVLSVAYSTSEEPVCKMSLFLTFSPSAPIRPLRPSSEYVPSPISNAGATKRPNVLLPNPLRFIMNSKKAKPSPNKTRPVSKRVIPRRTTSRRWVMRP